MRSGLLTERITIFSYADEQSVSGEITKVRRDIISLRCHVFSQSHTGNDESAKELFDGKVLVFQVRDLSKEINDTQFISYDNENYQITFIEKIHFDKTLKITAKKIND